MKMIHYAALVLLALSLAACNGSSTPAEGNKPTPAKSTLQPDSKAAAAATPAQQPQLAKQTSGTVLEAINTAGYTYIRVKTADKEIWVAAPEFKVAVNDAVIIPEGMAMTNYHSKTLNRDFDVVYFVNGVITPNAAEPLSAAATGGCTANMGKTAASGADAASHIKAAPAIKIDYSGLHKPDGGYTIAELFANKEQLQGKEVTLRAKVVKFTPNIMHTNWIHLRDGSGSEGSNDLTVTSNAEVNMADTVLVKGVLEVNKDFGYGYKYDLIIEKAQITKE